MDRGARIGLRGPSCLELRTRASRFTVASKQMVNAHPSEHRRNSAHMGYGFELADGFPIPYDHRRETNSCNVDR